MPVEMAKVIISTFFATPIPAMAVLEYPAKSLFSVTLESTPIRFIRQLGSPTSSTSRGIRSWNG